MARGKHNTTGARVVEDMTAEKIAAWVERLSIAGEDRSRISATITIAEMIRRGDWR